MCVIYACQSGRPSMDELEAAAFRNDDGAGVAWRKADDPHVIHWSKGFKNEKDLMKFVDSEKLKFPYALHFRTASVGGVDPELCHPFPLAKGAPTWLEGTAEEVLFHNGHVTSWDTHALSACLGSKEKMPEGPWSDTRALAWLTWMKGPGIIPFIGEHSRVLLFHAYALSEEDAPYDAATDHFTFYGNWIHHAKEGYSQSISVSPFKSDVGRARGDGVVHIVEPSRPLPLSAASVWTVQEIEDLLAKLEKEQNDARLVAGV